MKEEISFMKKIFALIAAAAMAVFKVLLQSKERGKTHD
jgi:hypothetical protein